MEKRSITAFDDEGCKTSWQVNVIDEGETPEGDPWVLLQAVDRTSKRKHKRRKTWQDNVSHMKGLFDE